MHTETRNLMNLSIELLKRRLEAAARSASTVSLGLVLMGTGGCEPPEAESIDEEENVDGDVEPRCNFCYEYFYMVNKNSYAVNASNHYNNGLVNMKSWNGSQNQWWIWMEYAPDNLQLYGTNYCLNAYKPAFGSSVDVYKCDKNDPEQHWDWISAQDGTDRFLVKIHGWNLCLNAHNVGNGTKLNLYTCSKSDPEQLFSKRQDVVSPGD